jgi:hypothetical protein
MFAVSIYGLFPLGNPAEDIPTTAVRAREGRTGEVVLALRRRRRFGLNLVSVRKDGRASCGCVRDLILPNEQPPKYSFESPYMASESVGLTEMLSHGRK